MASTFNPKGIRGKATTLCRDGNGTIRCTLYGTVVFTLSASGKYCLSTGGYNTPTTHRRMNDCLQHLGQPYPVRKDCDGHQCSGRVGTSDFRDGREIIFQGVPFNGKLPAVV